SIPVSGRAAMTALAKSPSSSVRIRAPDAATSVISSWCRGRSRMAIVRSWTRTSRAKAMRRRLSTIESSRSIAPRAPGPATNFSTCETAGRGAKPSGSTATSSETALIWPRGPWQALRGTNRDLGDAALQGGRAEEIAEQRARPVRPRAELGVELARHEPRVMGKLDDLDQSPVGRKTAEIHARLVHDLGVLVV